MFKQKSILGLLLISMSGLAKAQILTDTAIPGHLLSVEANSPLTVYNNTGNAIFNSGVNPAYVLDDYVLSPNATTLVSSLEFGFYTFGGNNDTITAQVRFFGGLQNADAALPVNSLPAGGFDIDLGRPDNGFYTTGLIDLSGLNLTIPGSGGVTIKYVKTVNQGTLATNASTFFYGGGVTTGSSQDIYFRDANGDGIFQTTEGRQFGGGSFLANIYLGINAVPEPGSMALMLGMTSMGGMLALRRRRK